MVESKTRNPKYISDTFENVEDQLRMTHNPQTGRSIMSFVEPLWGIEVIGGVDQFQPLTIINVTRTGWAHRAGIRIGDEITKIDSTKTVNLTFNEAVELFKKTSRYMSGIDDGETEEGWTYDVSVTRLRRFKPINWDFPWNDRRKPIYRESNCFMVPSRMEEKIRQRRAATSAVKNKEESNPHTRSLTPTPRPNNQPGENLLNTVLRPRGPPPRD